MFNDVYTKNLFPTIVLGVSGLELVLPHIKTVLLIVDETDAKPLSECCSFSFQLLKKSREYLWSFLNFENL
jgi:hypothetical protein